MTARWTIDAEASPSYRCISDPRGKYVLDVHGLVDDTPDALDIRARRVAAALNAVEGIPTEDLERLEAFGDYLRLLKLSHLADRQAATMEGAPPDPFISVGVTA